jgi:hypothetical protein
MRYLLAHTTFTVRFVAQQQHSDALVAIIISLVNPEVLEVVNGSRVRQIVHHYYTVRALIVRGGNSAETFLPSRIPDLKFDVFAFVLDRLEST